MKLYYFIDFERQLQPKLNDIAHVAHTYMTRLFRYFSSDGFYTPRQSVGAQKNSLKNNP